MSDWIAVDWSRDTLRAWAMSGNAPKAFAQSETGTARLDGRDPEDVLLELIGSWPGLSDVIACGDISARGGWAELPCPPVPCLPPVGAGAVVATRHPGLRLRLIPGVAQNRPADIMHGDETRIAGFLRINPKFDGTLCLPGARSAWAQISAGEIVSFQTFLTGELHRTLTRHSLLSPTLAGDAGADFDSAAFAEGVDQGRNHPEKLLARLSGLVAEDHADGLPPSAARARLSGLLIGAELAGARPYWLGAEIAVIAEPALGQLYVTALRAQSAPALAIDREAATLAGLIAARDATQSATT